MRLNFLPVQEIGFGDNYINLLIYFLITKYLTSRCVLFLLFTAGLIQPDGEINWACPCLGGMATGPCGVEFREAFSCFHYSTAEPKGSDCLEPFRQMSDCMAQYPNVYGSKDDKDEVATTTGDLSNDTQTSGEVAAKA